MEASNGETAIQNDLTRKGLLLLGSRSLNGACSKHTGLAPNMEQPKIEVCFQFEADPIIWSAPNMEQTPELVLLQTWSKPQNEVCFQLEADS